MHQYITKEDLHRGLDTTKEELHQALDTTKQEILKAIQIFSSKIDEEMVTKRYLKEELKNFATKSDFEALITTMVTKDYLNQKISEHLARHVGYSKNVDKKVVLATELLKKKKIFTREESATILAIKTFPRE